MKRLWPAALSRGTKGETSGLAAAMLDAIKNNRM